MLATISLYFLAVGAQGAEPDAATLITKMFRHYSEAQTLTGQIRWIQRAKGIAIQTDTDVAFERPSKLYIKQTQNGSEPKTWLITSDGKLFSYNKPEVLRGPESRLVEPVFASGVSQSIRDIYAVGIRSIGDKSVPLDIAISRREDLSTLRGQWATFQVVGKEKLRETNCYVIEGKWREDPGMRPTGTYQLWLSPDGDILRFALKELFASPQGEIEVTSTWDASLVVNGQVNAKQFTVVK
ncbi:MAG: hypothetical protein ACOYON_03295 [Fimbriimonas sp.]